jgi:hypothetical protein
MIFFAWNLIYIDYKIWKNKNNKSKKQVLLKLVGQNGVQKYFFIRKLNEINILKVKI